MKVLFSIFVIFLFTNSSLYSQGSKFMVNIDFENEIENNNLQMIIYYNSDFDTLIPLSADRIRNGYYEYKIIISKKILDKNKSMIEEINNIEICEVPEDAWRDANGNRRIVCDFVNDKNEIILSFTYGHGRYVYLNSNVIERNDHLRKLLKLFLNDSIDFYRDYPDIS